MRLNILLLIKCSFTLIGIKELFSNELNGYQINIISGVKGLIDFDHGEKIDIVVAESGRYPSEIANALMIPSIVKCMCVLITGELTDVEKGFYKKSGFDCMINNRAPKKDLKAQITNSYTSGKMNNFIKNQYPRKEREVLFNLLHGKNMRAISRDMNISYKMVSHYKSAALHRVGAKSIVDIARGGEIIRLRNRIHPYFSS